METMASRLMFHTFLLCGLLISSECSSHRFENVALRKPCEMSSRLSWTSGQHLPGVAVNGDTNGDFINTRNCIHTLESDTSPWWEVDLGRSYPVYSVVVWARNGHVGKMKGCVITVDGQECYRFDNIPASRETNVTCTSGVLNGSVVRVSKDTTGLSPGERTINMCEFEVIICSDYYWGSGCDRRCGNCSNDEVCDMVTGHCSSCPPGLQPPLCDTECETGTYGHNCRQTCSEGCEDVCDKVSGNCTCKPDWLGPACDTVCPGRTYGLNCMQNCSVHCSDPCDKATGHCACNRGYSPPLCLTEIQVDKMESESTIIGGAVGGSVVVLVVIIIIVVIVVRRIRSRPKATGKRENSAQEESPTLQVNVYQNVSDATNGNMGNLVRDNDQQGAGLDSARILSSKKQRNPVTLSTSQSDNVYEAVEGEVNHGYVNSQRAMPATTQNPAERSQVPAEQTYVVEGKSSIEAPREASALPTDQPYEVVDRDRENTYEQPRMYMNTGDHHVYSDLKS